MFTTVVLFTWVEHHNQCVKPGSSHNSSPAGGRSVTADLQFCLCCACWPPHLPACAAWHRLQFVPLKSVLTSSRTVALPDGSHAERLSALGVGWALSCAHNERHTLGLIILESVDISVGALVAAAAVLSSPTFIRGASQLFTIGLWMSVRDGWASMPLLTDVNNAHNL